MPGNDLSELMSQANAMRMIQPEGSYEWFDDMIPKAKKLLQQIQREQNLQKNSMTSTMFNQVRDCCDQLDNWIKQLHRHRDGLDKQKGNVIKSEMNRLSIHNNAYTSFRGFFGK